MTQIGSTASGAVEVGRQVPRLLPLHCGGNAKPGWRLLGLGGLHVFGPWPFGAVRFAERDRLPDLKRFVTDAFHARLVEEHILPIRGFDESKTFVRQPFDLAIWHFRFLQER